MSVNPFDRAAQHAQAEQDAAMQAFRDRAALAREGTGQRFILPFGKQGNLDRYAGMRVVPFVKNPFVPDPSVLLEHPDPTAHYGLAKRDDPEVRGKLRAGDYEDVFIFELKTKNNAGIGISLEDYAVPKEKIDFYSEIDPAIAEILTERSVSKLVLWHGLQLVKIPHNTWVRDYEEPALQGSSARLRAHADMFNEGSMSSTVTTHRDYKGTDVAEHETGASFGRVPGVQTEFKVEA